MTGPSGAAVMILLLLILPLVCDSHQETNLGALVSLLKRPEIDGCVLVAFRLGRRTLKQVFDATLGIGGALTRDLGDDRQTYWWRNLARCFVGLAQLEEVSELQAILGDVPEKRILLLRNNTEVKGPTPKQVADLAALDRRHHPPLILGQTNSVAATETALASISCRRQGEDGRVRLTKFDAWRPLEGWRMGRKIRGDDLERYCNGGHQEMHGKEVVVNFFDSNPWLIVGKNGTLSGLAVDMVSILEEALGFTALRVTPSPSTPFGRRMKNGTHTGILGIVPEGVAEMSATGAMVFRGPHSFPRGTNTTNSNYWYPREQIFVTQAPRELSPIFNIGRVFDKATWLWTLAVLLFCTVALQFFAFFENETVDFEQDAPKFLAVLFTPLGSMFQESVPLWQRDLLGAGRRLSRGTCIIIMWVICTFILVKAYEGNLKAATIVKNYEKPIDRLLELVERDVVIHTTFELRFYLRSFGADSPLVNKLGEQIDKHKSYFFGSSDDVHLVVEDKILKEGGASFYFDLVNEMRRTEFLLKGKHYPLRRVEERFTLSYISMLLPFETPRFFFHTTTCSKMPQKGLIFRRFLIDPVLSAMMEAGVVDKLLRKYIARQIKNTADSLMDPLRLIFFFIPGSTWLALQVFAILILFMEVCLGWVSRKKRRVGGGGGIQQ